MRASNLRVFGSDINPKRKQFADQNQNEKSLQSMVTNQLQKINVIQRTH